MKRTSAIKNRTQAPWHLHGPLALIFVALSGLVAAAVPIAPGELVAPKFEIVGGTLNFTVQPSVAGRSYQLQYSEMEGATWLNLDGVVFGDGNNLVITTPHLPGVSRRFFRLALDGGVTPVPVGFALIPAGDFQMGDSSDPHLGYSDELPVHSVYVSAFYLGKYEVTKELWSTVRTWGGNNGFTDLPAGNGSYASKGANHPVHSISWNDMVKWCNARSLKEGLVPSYTVGGVTYKTGNDTPECNWGANGYRLPSEAEWEKAARGGLTAKNFPWGDTISHSQSNYKAELYTDYDVSPTQGYHPNYAVNKGPFTSPVGSFAPNGFGLYDITGNLTEWCWDWLGNYAEGTQVDPRGADSGAERVYRGGSWINYARFCRISQRSAYLNGTSYHIGFRLARSSAP